MPSGVEEVACRAQPPPPNIRKMSWNWKTIVDDNVLLKANALLEAIEIRLVHNISGSENAYILQDFLHNICMKSATP